MRRFIAVLLLALAACPSPAALSPAPTPTTSPAASASAPVTDDELRPGDGLLVTATVQGDGERVDVVAHVTPAHAPQLRVGLVVRFQPSAFPDSVWMARVSAIEGDVVRCSTSNIDQRLKRGMVGKLFVDLSEPPPSAPEPSPSNAGE